MVRELTQTDARNCSIASRKPSLSSMCGIWPTLGNTVVRASGIRFARSSATRTGLTRSCSPTKTKQGASTAPRRSRTSWADRRAGLTSERGRILRPGVALGEPDQSVDLLALSVERRSDQPRERGAGESAGVHHLVKLDPRLDHRLPPRRSTRRATKPAPALRTRRGWRIASSWATRPPSDWPTM